ncbi:DUF1501 domain-containing protein [Roseimicrobium sp. ORNL1]|uniref:DUF1501 domain-containing protein n=1 Tax=Roseimicrobium sp. ORNL1 TaxID=2711231 RepID=UPI0013E14FDF|nr:DUF1501 domain-containing protein [Roseimicrobium sp. ORNL1]QIF04939.1 DUF1501 domain-containing protein [Roseimicrobium sp. ORNL1]
MIGSYTSRRQLLSRLGLGFGGMAFSSLLAGPSAEGNTAPVTGGGALPGLPHFAPQAKRVIFLFMSGGPSHVDSFDYKPELQKLQGKSLPDSFRKGRQSLPGMSGNQTLFQLKGSSHPFTRCGQSGAWVSNAFPHLARVADDLCFVKSMVSESVNHDPAITFIQTGSPIAGRPSAGSWIQYGLGRENENLPAFIVLISRRSVDQPLSSKLWGSGFLPARYDGVQLRASKDPVLYLSDPPGIPREANRRMLDGLKELQSVQPDAALSADADARWESYEMAFRMQTAIPEVMDLSKEQSHVFDLYGPDSRTPGTFASNCLQARRLAERGVRFIQLFHPGWDQHSNMEHDFPITSREVDQASAALITDLKERGMLKDTLVVWGGEFGRTPYMQGRVGKGDKGGRDHHPNCFTFWMAGGGIKPGITYGESDELGYHVAQNKVHVHDFHATMLHLLGINHERFTYHFQGRDFRLTDVSGNVVKEILSKGASHGV